MKLIFFSVMLFILGGVAQAQSKPSEKATKSGTAGTTQSKGQQPKLEKGFYPDGTNDTNGNRRADGTHRNDPPRTADSGPDPETGKQTSPANDGRSDASGSYKNSDGKKQTPRGPRGTATQGN